MDVQYSTFISYTYTLIAHHLLHHEHHHSSPDTIRYDNDPHCLAADLTGWAHRISQVTDMIVICRTQRVPRFIQL